MDIHTLSTSKQEEIQKLPMMPFGLAKDLTGQTFGHLTILGRDSTPRKETRSRTYVWCICDCPEQNIVSLLASNVTGGKVKSCGCLRKKVASDHAKQINTERRIDLKGQTFGFLYVEREDLEQTKLKNRQYWKCKCLNCNREDYYSVRTDQLTSGLTTMCNNCSDQISMGAMAILKLLSENKILYVTEKRFQSCRFPDTNAQAKFDFYLPDKKYIIEFDGEQHFRESQFFDNLSKIQAHDAFKNQWCQENNIPLIRIPYWKRHTLVLEDLLLETTKYRIC